MNIYIIKLIFLTISIIVDSNCVTSSYCDCGDWFPYEDEKCFKVFDSMVPQSEAVKICKQSGSILGIIRTKEEQDVVNDNIKSAKILDNLWLGITRIDNSFEWSDGSKTTYTNWAKGRPLNSTDLDCAVIGQSFIREGGFVKWLDVNCGKKNAVLCQKHPEWSNDKIQSELLKNRRDHIQDITKQQSELDNLKKITIPKQQKLIDSQRKQLDHLETLTIPKQQKLIDSQRKQLDHLENIIIPKQQNELDYLKKTTIPKQQELIDSQRNQLDNLKTDALPKMQKLIEVNQNELDDLKKTSISELKNSILAQNNELNNLKSNPVPIGFIYIQLSGQSDPKTLWPNTNWKNVSANYSGLFFRAEGGQSSPFGQIQEQLTQMVQIYNDDVAGDSVCTFRDWKTPGNKQLDRYIFTGGIGGKAFGINIKLNNDETRPRNQAIRIWQRIK